MGLTIGKTDAMRTTIRMRTSTPSKTEKTTKERRKIIKTPKIGTRTTTQIKKMKIKTPTKLKNKMRNPRTKIKKRR